MKYKNLPQEGLKLIACITMLIDHIGARILPFIELRLIGRFSFPIYCFLLAEGAVKTRDPRRYGLRLAAGMVLAELPFDLLFYGWWTWAHQSVMVTLLLGYLMILAVERLPRAQLVPVIVFAGLAQLLNTDYGAMGILMIALFFLTQEREDRNGIRVLGTILLCWLKGGAGFELGFVTIPYQIFGAAALVPILCYSGRKVTRSKALQWAFYLFYPVHLAVLYLMVR